MPSIDHPKTCTAHESGLWFILDELASPDPTHRNSFKLGLYDRFPIISESLFQLGLRFVNELIPKDRRIRIFNGEQEVGRLMVDKQIVRYYPPGHDPILLGYLDEVKGKNWVRYVDSGNKCKNLTYDGENVCSVHLKEHALPVNESDIAPGKPYAIYFTADEEEFINLETTRLCKVYSINDYVKKGAVRDMLGLKIDVYRKAEDRCEGELSSKSRVEYFKLIRQLLKDIGIVEVEDNFEEMAQMIADKMNADG